jgi:hypothetical protein
VAAFWCEADHLGDDLVVVGLVLDQLIDCVIKLLIIAIIGLKLAPYATIG